MKRRWRWSRRSKWYLFSKGILRPEPAFSLYRNSRHSANTSAVSSSLRPWPEHKRPSSSERREMGFEQKNGCKLQKRGHHEKRRHLGDHCGGVRHRLDDGIRMGYFRIRNRERNRRRNPFAWLSAPLFCFKMHSCSFPFVVHGITLLQGRVPDFCPAMD